MNQRLIEPGFDDGDADPSHFDGALCSTCGEPYDQREIDHGLCRVCEDFEEIC